MAKISVLAAEISQKIAAGEVVERPVSVVKELVENSLDAGATEVRVELQGGGKKLIRVQDNGSGMSREDALLAFARHSTSKIQSEEDLERIVTLGFRGEALPSISTVSRLTLRTSEGEQGGTEIEHEAEALLAVKDIGYPRGTQVEVRDLFFNLPARLKFLRSEQSELGVVTKFLSTIALAFPGVTFSLVHGKREIFDWPRVATLRERLFQVYGRSLVERLIEVDYAEDGRRISGFASQLAAGRGDKSHQFFFVNRRPIKDRMLAVALNQAFQGLLEKGFSAEAFLFLDYPAGDVDVNVHPTKAEVRFRDSQAAFRLVLRGIEHAVLRESTVKAMRLPGLGESRFVHHTVEEGPGARLFGQRESLEVEADRAASGQQPETKKESAWRVLGQYLGTYIVAASPEGLFVIDQHNAHEKVLYERYKEIHGRKRWPAEQALMPLLFDLSPSQVLSLEENRGLFEESGFRVEESGGRTYALKEYPGVMKADEAVQVFLTLLEEVQDEKKDDRAAKLLATLACKTAVKAGEPLLLAKMEYLVEELFKLPQQGLCPHGRPVLMKLERAQIEKGLRRSSS